MTSIVAELMTALEGRNVPDLPDVLRRVLAADAVDVLLIDHQHVSFQDLLTGAAPADDSRLHEALRGRHPDVEGCSVVMPLAAGGDPLGVIHAQLAGEPDDALLDALAHHVAPLLALYLQARAGSSDLIPRARRRRKMALAAEIQWGLLPPAGYTDASLRIEGAVEPAYETGGDVFDYTVLDGTAMLTVLDAMGHGLQAAVVSTLAIGALRQARRNGAGLTDQFDAIDRAMKAQYQDQAYVAGVAVEMDLRDGRIRWITAGHEGPLVCRSDGDLDELPIAAALPLGLDVGTERDAWQPHEDVLAGGETLVLHSDGVLDNLDQDGNPFGADRFHDVLRTLSNSSALDVWSALHRILDITGKNLRDDATVLLAHRPPA